MLRKQGGGGGRNILDKISNVVSPTTLKRDESSIRKLLIHIASIFLSQLTNIRQNFFSNYYYYCCNRLLLDSTNTFHEHWLSYIYLPEERTSHPEDNHDLSFPHSRPNRTIDHSLNNTSPSISPPRKSPSVPWNSSHGEFLIAHSFSPFWHAEHRDNALSRYRRNVWYLTGRGKVSEDHSAVIVPARHFHFPRRRSGSIRPRYDSIRFLPARSNFARRAFLPTEEKPLLLIRE